MKPKDASRHPNKQATTKWNKNHSQDHDYWFAKDWDYGQTSSHNISFGLLKFSKLYNRKMLKMRYCLAFLVGIFSAFFGFLLLQKTGIYSLGVSALFQGISRLIFFFATKNQASNPELIYVINFWVLNLLFNLPLAWFAYLKIGKHFALLSIVSIISSSLMGLILSTIPGLKDFYIFGNPLTEDSQLFINKIQILQWSNHFKNGNNVSDGAKLGNLFTYGLMIGFITTLPNTIIYIIGGSTGGIDFIVFYYSKKKLKPFAALSSYLAVAITVVAFLVGTYLPYVLVAKENWLNVSNAFLLTNFFSPILIATLLSVWIRKVIVNYFYPQFKIMSVKIYVDDIRFLRNLLVQRGFAHAFTINNSIGGYSLKFKANIEVVCFFREIQEIFLILNEMKKTKYLIFATPVQMMRGQFRCRSEFD